MGGTMSKSDSSPSPRNKRGAERHDKYKMRRKPASRRSDDDDFAWHTKHRTSRHYDDVKQKPSSSRNRSHDSFRDYHRKISDTQRHHHQRNLHRSRSRRSRSDSSDEGYSRRYRQPPSHYKLKKTSSPRKSRYVSSDDSVYKKKFLPRNSSSFSSVNSVCRKKKLPRKSSSFSSDESVSRHCNRINAVCEQKSNEKNSDIEVIEEVRPKTYRRFVDERSKSKTFSSMNLLYEKSSKYLKEGNLKKALHCINLSLRLTSEENEFVSKIYSRRGVIYSLLEKPACSLQGFLDFEHAYIIDKNNIEARQNMSKVLFMGGNMCFRNKEYDKALNLVNHALDLDDRNGEAYILSHLLKRKIGDKEREKQRRMEELAASKIKKASEVRRNPEKSFNPEAIHKELAVKKLKHLSSMIKEALRKNNNEQALQYLNKALRIFEKDFPDDKVHSDLLILRQHIMNQIP